MHAFKASISANTLLTPSFCPNESSLLEDYPALQAFSLGAPVLLSALIIPVSTPPYSTAKKRTSWGESKGEGEGAERENKKTFPPLPTPVSLYYTNAYPSGCYFYSAQSYEQKQAAILGKTRTKA